MNSFGEARQEIRDYFTSWLGVDAQRYDVIGHTSDPDPSGRRLVNILSRRERTEAARVARCEAILKSLPSQDRAVLRAWGEPRKSRARTCDCTRAKKNMVVQPCRHDRVAAALGELEFVAPLTALAQDLCRGEVDRLSDVRLAHLAAEASKLLDGAIEAYDARRVASVAAEREARLAKKAARAAEESAVLDRIAAAPMNVRSLFTPEESARLAALAHDLYYPEAAE